MECKRSEPDGTKATIAAKVAFTSVTFELICFKMCSVELELCFLDRRRPHAFLLEVTAYWVAIGAEYWVATGWSVNFVLGVDASGWQSGG